MRVEKQFNVGILRRGTSIAHRLNIATRYLCRDLQAPHEAPRPGHSNPDLAAIALRAALEEAHLKVNDLAYLVGHITSLARLVPPNVCLVADYLGYTGPYMELRQACTGFADTPVIAQGLVSVPGSKRWESSALRLAPSTLTHSARAKMWVSW